MTTPDALKELPEGTFDNTWALPDRVANLFGIGDRIPVAAQAKLAQSSLPAIRFLILQTEIERAFRIGQLANLPTLAERIELESPRDCGSCDKELPASKALHLRHRSAASARAACLARDCSAPHLSQPVLTVLSHRSSKHGAAMRSTKSCASAFQIG